MKKTVSKKTVDKKDTAAKAVSAAKAVVSAKAGEDAKKAEEVKTEETKAEDKPAEAKATKAAKTTKTTRATKAAKTTKTTKSTKSSKASSEKIILQVNGREDMSMSGLIDKVKAAYVAEGHSADSIKEIEVYIKLNENMAYYVIDGYASGISLY